MKKLAIISSALAAVLATVLLAVPAFAESDPADDAEDYSYNTGKESYETRMAESSEWYDNEDESVTSGYSFNTGSQSAQARNNAFAGMPSGDEVAKEDIESWFAGKGFGSGAAYSDGQYNESAKSSYGYQKGQAAYQERHASFTGNN